MEDKNSCGICGKTLTADDDKVYCPDCATPMHRECWAEKKACPNEDKHSEGYDWDKAHDAKAEIKKPVQKSRDGHYCAVCKHDIHEGEDIVVCPQCGTPAHRACWERTNRCPNFYKHGTGYSWNEEHRDKTRLPDEPEIITDMSDFVRIVSEKPALSHETGKEITFDGATQAEMLTFLGKKRFSTALIFPKFLRMASGGRKIGLNLFAGLLMPYYQFYRRMTGPAIILMLLSFVLSVPDMAIVYSQYAEYFGIGTFTVADGLGNVAQILSVIAFILQIAVLLFNDYFYMKWSAKRILSLREKYKDSSTDEYNEALEKAGNPRWLGVVLSFIGMYLLTYLLLIFFM